MQNYALDIVKKMLYIVINDNLDNSLKEATMKKHLCFLVSGILLVSSVWAQNVTWTQVNDALRPFSCGGGGALGNYFYCFGDELENLAQAFNLTAEQWEASTPAPLGWRNWTGVATDDAVYLICRNYGTYGNLYGNEVQKFTPTAGGPTGVWTQVANYPIETCGVAAAWDGGNYIYSAGGNPSPGVTNAYRYDIAADTWTAIADLPIANRYAGGACVNGKFYVVGGTNADDALYEYNPDNNTWTVKASVPVPVNFCNSSVVSNGDLIFSVGGGSNYMAWTGTDAVQVYDPMTDTWTQETPMPAARGRNSVCFVPPDKVINAGGLTSIYAFSSTADTYRGSGFPGGVTYDVSITLTPINPPIQIPASGGSFDFNVALTNNETGPATFDAWIMAELPNGSFYGPLLGPVDLTLPGSASIDRNRTQSVPAGAPSGTYGYWGYVGSYPNGVWSSDSFAFEKLADGDGTIIDGWECTGEGFEQIAETLTGNYPSDFALIGNYPNPFNPTTAISYRLSAVSFVNLTVYDVTGCLVAELVNGWRDAGMHEVMFNGSHLASGVYLYRLALSGSGLEGGLSSATPTIIYGKMVLMK